MSAGTVQKAWTSLIHHSHNEIGTQIWLISSTENASVLFKYALKYMNIKTSRSSSLQF